MFASSSVESAYLKQGLIAGQRADTAGWFYTNGGKIPTLPASETGFILPPATQVG
jgi:hypothetical protein